MPTGRIATLLRLLRESRLLDAAQMAELESAPEAVGDDPKPLARAVVRRAWLTRYQVREILEGRATGLVLGPYQLRDLLGIGGMGEVYRAYHPVMDRTIALKVIRKERLVHPDAARRFAREVKASANLRHPNVVLAYDAGQSGNTLYLAMEYLEGTDLYRLVQESGRLPVERACEYARQAALGLQAIHEARLVHRDVKPSNLMLTADASGAALIKILDLGLCRLREEDESTGALTQPGKVIGTVAYLAPEQAKNSHGVDIRADLYSLGCTLYYLLAARDPFLGEAPLEVVLQHHKKPVPPLSDVRGDVPAEVEVVLRKLMAKLPDDRYSTPAEAAAALAPYCRSDAAPTPAPTPRTDDPRWLAEVDAQVELAQADRTEAWTKPQQQLLARPPRRRWHWVVGALAILVLGAALAWWPRTSPPVPPPTGDPPRVPPVAEEPPPVPPVPIGVRLHEAPTPGRAMHLPNLTGVVAVSANGGLAAAADAQNIVHVWEWETGLERRTVRASGTVRALAFTGDGGRLLVGESDGSLRLVNLTDGVSTLIGRHESDLRAAALSADGSRVLAASGANGLDETVRLWDVSRATELRRLVGHNGLAWAVALSADGQRAVTGGKDQTVRWWDTATGREVGPPYTHGGEVRSVAVAADGSRYASGGNDRTVRVRRADGREVAKWPLDAGVTALAFTLDGMRLAGGDLQGVAYLWDVEPGREVWRQRADDGAVRGVVASPDGRWLLVGGQRGARLWPLP